MPKVICWHFSFSLFHKLHAAKYSTSRQVRVYCKKYHWYHHHRHRRHYRHQHNYWLLQRVFSFGCNHNAFWQEWWLITATQLCWQYDSSRCMMGDVVQEEFLFFTPAHAEFVSSVDPLLYLQGSFPNVSFLCPLKSRNVTPGCKSGWRRLVKVFVLIIFFCSWKCSINVFSLRIFLETNKQIQSQVKTSGKNKTSASKAEYESPGLPFPT